MDKVLIEGLTAETVIGVYGWEREVRQRLEVDLILGWDNRPAAAGDDVALALDYARVAGAVTGWVEQSQFQLVEALAEHLADRLMAEFRVEGLRLTLRKPGAVANARAVGVEIERGLSLDGARAS